MTALVNDIQNELSIYQELRRVPQERIRNFRNDLYIVSESMRLMESSGTPGFSEGDEQKIGKDHLTYALPFGFFFWVFRRLAN